MGSVEQLKSGKYRAIAWNHITRKRIPVRPGDLNPDDKRRSFDTWDAANRAIERYEASLDGTYVDAGTFVPRQTRRVTFADYSAQWLKVQGGAQASRYNRAVSVDVLTATFGDRLIDDITRTDVRAWVVDLEATGRAPGTIQQRLICLGQIMQSAVQDHLRTDDPTADLAMSNQRVGSIRYLSDQELMLMLCYLPAWFWPAALLAADSGLRASEVAGLRWFRLHLDGDDPYVEVVDVMERDLVLRGYPKGKESGAVPLTPRTVEALRVLRRATAGQDDDFVFRNSRGGPMCPRAVGATWRKARNRYGFTGTAPKFHHLRHLCANNLAKAGAPAPVIQAVLRHRNLSTSQGYIEAVHRGEQKRWMSIVAGEAAAVGRLAAHEVDDELLAS